MVARDWLTLLLGLPVALTTGYNLYRTVRQDTVNDALLAVAEAQAEQAVAEPPRMPAIERPARARVNTPPAPGIAATGQADTVAEQINSTPRAILTAKLATARRLVPSRRK